MLDGWMKSGLRIAASAVLTAALVYAGDISQLYGKANKLIRNSERSMHSGRIDKAKQQLDEANALIGEMKQLDASNKKVISISKKYARQEKMLARKLPKNVAKAKPATTVSKKSDKLPSGVKSRITKIERLIPEIEKGRHYRIKEVDQYMFEITDRYGHKVSADHPQMVAIRAKVEKLKSDIAGQKEQEAQKAAEAARFEAQMKAQSEAWLVKIRPYIANNPGYKGYDKDKYFIASATQETAEMQRRMKLFDEVKALHEAYMKESFKLGKTDELQRAEKQLVYAIESFEQTLASQTGDLLRYTQQKIDEADAWLKRTEAADDGTTPPNLLHKDLIPNINGMIAQAEKSGIAASKISPLKSSVKSLEARADKLRKLRVDRTVMIPNRYTQSDKNALHDKAKSVVMKAQSGTKVLRATIINSDWEENSGWEFTDTTKTKSVYKTRRGIRAQVAAKSGGKVALNTVYLEKEKRTDGSWSGVKGHVMYSQPMLEKNVGK